MKTILVTGGAGFIGSNFVHLAIEANHNVINLDALTYSGNEANLAGLKGNPNHKFVVGSINDRDMVVGLLNEFQPDWIVNFAAETHVDRAIDGPRQFVETNIGGTFEMLEASRNHIETLSEEAKSNFRFLQVSTDEVYGSIEHGKFRESDAYVPNSPYSASKAAADHLVRAYNKTYGLPTLITNCGNNYGPWQFPEKLIPLVLTRALEGKPLPIYGDGGNVRDWIFAADHCLAILGILQDGTPGETYNVGSGNERTNIEIVHGICDLLDQKEPRQDGQSYRTQIEFVADRPGHDRRYAIDSTKIEQQLGWKPTVTFEQGLQETVTWYLENRSWSQEIQDNRYDGARLGLNPEKTT